MENFLEGMLAVNLFFQTLGSWLLYPMLSLTFLGSEEFYVLFGPALYWCFNAGIGLRAALFLNVSISLNAFLKFSFQGPRPFWISSEIVPHAAEGSFGVPSGHAMNSATILGALGWYSRKTWALWAAAILILLIGVSRLYLGVHFLHDVLLGWALGLILLGLVIALEKPVLRWILQQKPGMQIGAAFAASLALLAPAAVVHFLLSDWTMPTAWAQTALRAVPDLELVPLSLEGTLSSVGAFFGLAAGALWINQRGGFVVDGSIGQRLARYLLGVIVILALWRGLGLLQPDDANLTAYVIRYARYAMTGFWITGLAPIVFRKLKI